jgi:hypothetical protein
MPSFDHISGAEPSTVTFKLRTVSMTVNSSKQHSEILALGDPDSSIAIAAVIATAPASTAWGLVTRPIGPLTIQGNSTVIIQGNSTVAPLAGSTWATRPIQSSAADLQMTATQGTNPWIIAGNSTVAPLAGSTWNTRPIQSSAADLQMTATPAAGSTWNVRALNSSAADLQVTATPSAGSTWNSRPIQSSAADLQMTATPLAGSTWNVRALCSSQKDLLNTVYQSSAAELQMTATPLAGSTWNVRALNSSAADLLATVTIGTNLQSTVAPSSNSSGLIVRQVIDGLTTFASTTALASTTIECASSAAGIRHYVTAYTITSTNQTPAQWGFYSSNGTLLWPMTIAAISSAVSGVNLAVAPPGYLFRTVAADALNFKTNGSTVISVQLGVSYYRAP